MPLHKDIRSHWLICSVPRAGIFEVWRYFCADQEKTAKMQEKNNMLSLKVLLQSTHPKSGPEKINVLEI